MADSQKLIGAAVAGTMIGISTMFALQGWQNDKKSRQREAKLQKLKERKERYLQNKLIEEFLNDGDEVK